MRRLWAIAIASVFIVFALSGARGDKDTDMVKLFKKNGCNECHSILALDVIVERKAEDSEDSEASGEAAAAKGEAKEEDEPDPPDLSGVGLERDAKWISNYLRKKEKIDGREHEKLFKGSTEERRGIAMWLADMKTKPEDLPKTEAKESTEAEAEED